MYRNVLLKIQRYIERRLYRMTIHADKALDKRGLTPEDVRRAVLNGRISEPRQKDDTGEYKYLIQGRIATGSEIIVVVKIERIDKEELVVIITVYRV